MEKDGERSGKGGWMMVGGGSSGAKGGRIAVSSGTLSMDLGVIRQTNAAAVY